MENGFWTIECLFVPLNGPVNNKRYMSTHEKGRFKCKTLKTGFRVDHNEQE